MPMPDKLVIVESPAKTKTIGQYLGPNFVVKSSKGHIRDLAISGPGGLGIDIEHDFKPEYKVIPDKKKTIQELNSALKGTKEVYLATDPDREGEAISWHLKETLDIGNRPVKRVIFNEITKPAVTEAFAHPTEIDMDLVSSQETRRILDRIIGFKLSKLLQSKIRSKSAGRVQSATLKLIVDREKEIRAFTPEEYFEIKAFFPGFEAKFAKFDGKALKITKEEKADEIINSLGPDFKVSSIDVKQKQIASKPPFITSTLQQEASSRLGFSPTKTMQVAQHLYEGVPLGNRHVGLITYMRTDSDRISDIFVKNAKEYIVSEFGKNYLGYPKHSKNKENVQNAHEAIRPTDCSLSPDTVKPFLSTDDFKLYRMIYSRALASLMKSSLYEQTTVEIDNNRATFLASGSKLLFDGYLKIYGKYESGEERSKLPPLSESTVLKAEKVEKLRLETQPPARFTEARLIKEMEDLGIGRPSTYAQTIQILKQRKYVTYQEKKFKPTEQGSLTIEELDAYFKNLVSANFSKKMENTLDDIAEGEKEQTDTLKRFYLYFQPLVDKAFKEMEKVKPRETGELCPKCGAKMVVRHGKYGDFEACSNYPKCKYIKPNPNKQNHSHTAADTGVTCPECHEGILVERVAAKGKNKGKKFYGCSRYPRCKYISPYHPTGEKCPSCGKPLVEDAQGNILCLDREKCGYESKS